MPYDVRLSHSDNDSGILECRIPINQFSIIVSRIGDSGGFQPLQCLLEPFLEELLLGEFPICVLLHDNLPGKTVQALTPGSLSLLTAPFLNRFNSAKASISREEMSMGGIRYIPGRDHVGEFL
jgi:hypothetical protein